MGFLYYYANEKRNGIDSWVVLWGGRGAGTVGLVRFYYTKRLHKFDFLKPKKYGYNVTITV